ncbi:hypothetical protein IP88_01305 [alpha proteobacterium AAP81b]|nr:hypothetical protein IP88_01305 [alpha proteobacterium AAP81b]
MVTISRSGGFEGSNERLALVGSGRADVRYRFQHFSLPDRFQIIYGGQIVFDSGFTGGGRSGTVPVRVFDGTSVSIRVITDNAGTA